MTVTSMQRTETESGTINGRLRLLMAACCAILPTSGLRKAAYRLTCGYSFGAGSRVGWLSVIAVKSLTLGAGSTIGSFNVFKGPIEVKIGERSRIGRNNRFMSAWSLAEARFTEMNYEPGLTLGNNCLILSDHYFDLFGTVAMGDGSWIAGHGSQFWTHGLSAMDRNITIGSSTYVASAALFSPGAVVGSRCIVALGAVVAGKWPADNQLIAGSPAKPIKDISEGWASGKYRFSFEDW